MKPRSFFPGGFRARGPAANPHVVSEGTSATTRYCGRPDFQHNLLGVAQPENCVKGVSGCPSRDLALALAPEAWARARARAVSRRE